MGCIYHVYDLYSHFDLTEVEPFPNFKPELETFNCIFRHENGPNGEYYFRCQKKTPFCYFLSNFVFLISCKLEVHHLTPNGPTFSPSLYIHSLCKLVSMPF